MLHQIVRTRRQLSYNDVCRPKACFFHRFLSICLSRSLISSFNAILTACTKNFRYFHMPKLHIVGRLISLLAFNFY